MRSCFLARSAANQLIRKRGVAALVVAAAVLVPAVASAATYQVGPTRTYTELYELNDILQPGDVVEVDGDATYSGDVFLESYGTAEAPVTVRGITVNGRRPLLEGSDYTLILYGGHYVVENLEVAGGAETCLVHKAADVVVRDTLVRDCLKHGILGTDYESGNLLLERVEVTRSGSEERNHQIYVATDEVMYPGSVFRMVGCWIHEGYGGNGVKSRSERTELYGNWIEGSVFHEIDLIGPQEHDPALVREDTDVVGNVFIKWPSSVYTIARVGGDGTGETSGRHRFANNTMILHEGTEYAIRVGGSAESVELHNNVIVGTAATTLWREEFEGTTTFSGVSNWISDAITLPDDRVSGIRGADPGFADAAALDFHPAAGSPLLDVATASPASPAGLEFPSAQGIPAYLPPLPGKQGSLPRNEVGGLDIGAFELGSEDVEDGAGGGPSGDGDGDDGDEDDGEDDDDGSSGFPAGGGDDDDDDDDGTVDGAADDGGCSVHSAADVAPRGRGVTSALILAISFGLVSRRRNRIREAMRKSCV